AATHTSPQPISTPCGLARHLTSVMPSGAKRWVLAYSRGRIWVACCRMTASRYEAPSQYSKRSPGASAIGRSRTKEAQSRLRIICHNPAQARGGGGGGCGG